MERRLAYPTNSSPVENQYIPDLLERIESALLILYRISKKMQLWGKTFLALVNIALR